MTLLAATQDVVIGPSPVTAAPVGACSLTGATPANVVEWDQVASLPWRESFDMAPLPAMVPTVERRRRVDGRSLAQVVRELTLEAVA